MFVQVFNRLQEIDEKRTRGLKEFICGAASAETAVAPIISRCLEGVSAAADSINEKEDSQKVIERFVAQSEVDFIFILLKSILYLFLGTRLASKYQSIYRLRICREPTQNRRIIHSATICQWGAT